MSLFPKTLTDILANSSLARQIMPIESCKDFHDWVRIQPKIETHVHLEAAVSADFYKSLTQPESWRESLPWERAPFSDLRAFIMAWVDLSRAMRTLSDFEKLAEQFVYERVKENIRYTEAYISPADFSLIRKRFAIAPEIFAFDEVLRAYSRGLKSGLAKNPGFEVRLIVDTLWISNADEREIIFSALKSSRSEADFFDPQGQHYLVGIGLGGAESHGDLSGRLEFIERVRALGFRVDIHSGEGVDPELHRESVEKVCPDRVAHGFSAVSENFVFDANVVMCPVSNLLLKTYVGAAQKHPVFDLFKKKVPIAIGSDDPLLLGHTFSLEYAFLHALSGDGEDFFKETQKNARERLFAPEIFQRVQHFC
ncbi:hypothetical protein EBU99_02805 [bacterium]|nr:hypothetical protein [bacterium]